MRKKELEIQAEIRVKVFDKCFRANDKEKYKRGRDILYKYYLQYYNCVELMETKRIIIFNLIYAERMLGHEGEVKEYILQWKKEMDDIPGYKESHADYYSNMLSYYCDCKEIELPKEEILEHYSFSLNYFRTIYEYTQDVDKYIRMKSIEFGICRVKKDFTGMRNIIQDIGSLINSEAEGAVEQMRRDLISTVV